MNRLSPHFAGLASASADPGPGAFAARVRELEQEVHAELRQGLSRGWRPGSGAAAAAGLTDWRDATVAAVVGRLGPAPGGFALLAVGGYGRRELAPFSDVDLLMLCSRGPDAGLAAWFSDVQHHLWDLGCRVSASVRTTRGLEADARGDPHLLTSLLDARRLAGEAALAGAAAAAAARALRSRRRRFAAERLAEAESLLEGSQREILVKEPNLKTGAGGLRSVQLAGWIAGGSVERLMPAALHRRLARARDFLLHLRCLLHLLAGRREDVLRVDWQPAAAQALGLCGSEGRRMVKLMRHVYQRMTDVVLALHSVVDAARPGGGPRRGRAPAAGSAGPAGAVAAAARSGGRRSAGLLEELAAAARAVRGGAAEDRGLFLSFRDLLLLPHSYPPLISLKLSGFLYAYVAPLHRVRHLVVYNPFHSYTVDQHSLEAVRELESFSERAASDPERCGPPARTAAKYRDSLWVVKVALLLHDVGKAYDGDHAKNSAEMARGWLRGLPTEALIKDMVVFLVENHLLLSTLARRGDPESEAVVGDLARELSRQAYPEEALDLLYLLTCADIAATNERAYSPWTAATLARLFVRASAAVSAVRAAEAGPSVVEERAAALLARGADASAADLARALGPRYCAANSPGDVLEDHADVAAVGPDSFRLRVSVFNDHLRVKIIARDRVGLFALLSGILLANGADIVRARIHTFRGIAIDEFIVADVHGNEILEQKMEKELSIWISDLRSSFERYWASPADLDRLIRDIERRTRPVNPALVRDTRVRVERAGRRGLRIELACTDRPALLYDLTHRLASLGLDVRAAAVDTTGWYVHDSFEAEAQGELDDAGLERLRSELAALAAPLAAS